MIDNIHNGNRGNIAGFKHRLTVGVDYSIIGVDLTVNIFFHNVLGIRPFQFKKAAEFVFVFQLKGVGCAYAVIWFGDDRIADLICKCNTAFRVIDHVVAGHGNFCLDIVFFHLGF